MATYLVQHGADPNDVSIDEKKEAHNLLMDAIVVNNTELASLLVEKGANIEHADEDGVTVLTQAAYLGEVGAHCEGAAGGGGGRDRGQ